MDRFERINGILIDNEQVEQFLEKLTQRYASWEIEDILNIFINKAIDRDSNEFEEFITGEQTEHIAYLEDKVDELERNLEEYKRKGNPKEVDDLERDYLRIIKEQKAALAALGAGHLRFGHEEKIKIDRREDGGRARPWTGGVLD